MLFFLLLDVARGATGPANLLAWPEPTRENRPWTRWWWLGSAVDTTNLTRQLSQFQQAGIGGVEICPIYGAKGYEDRFIDFLSPRWMGMLAHTTAEAKRLGLGVDMTTGTGWPFGGPGVSVEDASAKLVLKRFDVAGGGNLNVPLPAGQLQCLYAISDKDERLDLTSKVADRRLDWTAPPGQWRLYAVLQDGPAQKVKRAAPGGVGNVLNPYSVGALDHYLARFDAAFSDYHGEMPRSQFQDSFEYYGAEWTPELFREFEKLRGYDLHTQLPALFGEGTPDTVARVKEDYRETISDLHLAFLQRWTAWSHRHGSLTREQAHGAPGNLLDLYATADIPETEIFGSIDEQNLPMNKFSSSAAHVTGKPLASSESFTWLTEHFHASLSQVKPAADYLFLSGVNHIFFHGIPYSPADAPWPGWQFYAAVNFGPQGGLWHDLPEFNAYVTRCQTILQSGRPSSDFLLYFPLADIFQKPDGILIPLTVENARTVLAPHPFYQAALKLLAAGDDFDYVSDRLLADVRASNGRALAGGSEYRAVVVPRCRLMSAATLARLMELARAGVPVVFLEALPADVPGLDQLDKRRAELHQTLQVAHWQAGTNPGVLQDAQLGAGLTLATNLDAFLQTDTGAGEPCAKLGIRFVRRARADGYDYLLVNHGGHAVDDWITLGQPAQSAAIMDPRFADRSGVAALRQDKNGRSQIYLQMEPGESLMVRTLTTGTISGAGWKYFNNSGPAQPVAGTWQAKFVEGGPELPAPLEMRELASWTTLGDAETKRFAGTARYTIEFEKPAGVADDWRLDLGRVCESARVRINGRDVGALWCEPFTINVGAYLKPGKNVLEVEVTNLAANRVRDLDVRKVNWKYFYDANVAVKDGRGVLDASRWPILDSGLLGPVILKPLKQLALQ